MQICASGGSFAEKVTIPAPVRTNLNWSWWPARADAAMALPYLLGFLRHPTLQGGLSLEMEGGSTPRWLNSAAMTTQGGLRFSDGDIRDVRLKASSSQDCPLMRGPGGEDGEVRLGCAVGSRSGRGGDEGACGVVMMLAHCLHSGRLWCPSLGRAAVGVSGGASE